MQNTMPCMEENMERAFATPGNKPHLSVGKYFLGVETYGARICQYLIQPELGGLKWMEGKVQRLPEILRCM